MIISLMVAYSKNRVIGKDNQLLWRLSDDLKNFKRVTSGHHIIMGRKTYESIGRPLPNRTNVIITRNVDFKASGCEVVHSLHEAIELAKNNGESEVIITGGGEIYRQALELIQKAYITEVDCEIDGDAYFPEFDFSHWNSKVTIEHEQDEKNQYNWTFYEYERPDWHHCP
jgi:dihydrofolate reductase